MNLEKMQLENVIDCGEQVICDICDSDYSNSDERGGFLFSSYAYCPKCAKEGLERIKEYGETQYIKAYCPDSMSFKDFILDIRNGDNTIKFYTEKDSNERN